MLCVLHRSAIDRLSFFVCLLQIPPPGKGSLYIRPLLMGTGAVLGLAPAPEYTFLIFVSPVGNYFKVFVGLMRFSIFIISFPEFDTSFTGRCCADQLNC